MFYLIRRYFGVLYREERPCLCGLRDNEVCELRFCQRNTVIDEFLSRRMIFIYFASGIYGFFVGFMFRYLKLI